MDYGAALEMRFGATHRGFESRPLRHARTTSGRPVSITPITQTVRARIPASSTHTSARQLLRRRCATSDRVPERQPRVVRIHAQLVSAIGYLSRRTSAWGPPAGNSLDLAALVRPHTREGQVRRPAPPLPPVPAAPRRTPRPRLAPRRRPLLSFPSRARRGTSGALYLQSAPAGLNPLPRSPLPNAARRRDVEDRVPRSGEPRTVSDPEGSSTKRSSPGAAERPGPSRPSRWARGRPARRRVHGVSTQARHGWR